MSWSDDSDDDLDSSDEALRNEILKDIPTVEEVVQQLQYNKNEKRPALTEGSPAKRNNHTRRIDRITQIRRDIEHDSAQHTARSVRSSRKVPMSKLDLGKARVLKDLRMERLRQTARETARSLSGASTARNQFGSAPQTARRPPPQPESFARPWTAGPRRPNSHTCSPLGKVQIVNSSSPSHNSLIVDGMLTHQSPPTRTLLPHPQHQSPSVHQSPSEHQSPSQQPSFKSPEQCRFKIDLPDHDQEDEEEYQSDQSEENAKLAEKMVHDYLQMENSVAKRVSEIPREELEPQKLRFGDLPENLQYYVFNFLDCKQLTLCTGVCKSFKPTILDSMRHIFTDVFGKYPENVTDRTLSWLLRRVHDLNRKKTAEVFFWATAWGYSKFVRRVIAGHEVPDMKSGLNAISKKDDMTALHIACRHGQLDALHLLLAAEGVNVNKLTKSGKHAITFAIDNDLPTVLHSLLTHHKINVNATDSGGVSVLYRACAAGNTEIVEALLLAEADPNQTDKEKRTALFSASEAGQAEVVALLLLHPDVKIQEPSKSGKSPLYVAAEKGHSEVVSQLLQNGANPRQETCRKKIPLYVAAELGFADVVRELLPFTVEEDLFKLTHYGTTPMFIASKHPNKKIKKMFVAFCMNQKKARRKAEEYMRRKQQMGDVELEDPMAAAKMSLMDDIDDALSKTVDPNHRAKTPRFAEHLERFRDYHKDKAMKNNFEAQRKERLQERLKEIGTAALGAANAAVDYMADDLDFEEEGTPPRPRSAASWFVQDHKEQFKPHVVNLMRNFDREAIKNQLHNQQEVDLSRPASAIFKMFPDDVEELRRQPVPRKGIRRGSNFAKKFAEVTRVEPRLNLLNGDKKGFMRPVRQAPDEDDAHKTAGAGVTIEQAQSLVQRQNDRIREAQRRAVAKITAERDRILKQREDVKRRREKARAAARRISIAKTTQLTLDPPEPEEKAESTRPTQRFGFRKERKKPSLAEIESKQVEVVKKIIYSPPTHKVKRRSRPVVARRESPEDGGTESPGIASMEQQLNEAQALVDEIRNDLEQAGKKPKPAAKKSNVDPRVKRFRAEARARAAAQRQAARALEQLARDQARKRKAESQPQTKRPPMRKPPKPSRSLPGSQPLSQRGEREDGYNPEKYATAAQKVILQSNSNNRSWRDEPEDEKSPPRESLPMSSPLREVERLERLAESLSGPRRVSSGSLPSPFERDDGFEITGRQVSRVPSIERFKKPTGTARQQRRKEVVMKLLERVSAPFNEPQEEVADTFMDAEPVVPVAPQRKERNRKKRMKRLEMAYGVKLKPARRKSRNPNPKPEPDLMIMGGGLF